jgi:AcrR family transcriptional regulator
MAAIKKIEKDVILNAAFQLVRKEGLESLSARKLAKEIECSTQPIYENFHDMGEIRDYTIGQMEELYDSLRTKLNEKEYADYGKQGMAVYEFAQNEKTLFKHFVTNTERSKKNELLSETSSLDMLVNDYGFDEDKARLIDGQMKRYILGTAFLLDGGYVTMNEERMKAEINNYFEFLTGKEAFAK